MPAGFFLTVRIHRAGRRNGTRNHVPKHVTLNQPCAFEKAAAGVLGYTQSAISQQLAALEREAGAALVDRSQRPLRATRAGSELQLSPIGLKLLTILMRESPRVVSRQEIEREIWGNGLPDSDTLRSHLYNLRKVIDRPFQKPLLHTVQTAGYRIADLELQPA